MEGDDFFFLKGLLWIYSNTSKKLVLHHYWCFKDITSNISRLICFMMTRPLLDYVELCTDMTLKPREMCYVTQGDGSLNFV